MNLLIVLLHLFFVLYLLFFKNLSYNESRDNLYSPLKSFFAYLPIFLPQFWAVYLNFNLSIDYMPFTLGVILFFIGFFLRLWSIQVLGNHFTMEIGIRKSHNLIIKGPYKWIRHPSYSGYLLMIFGIGISLQNNISLYIPLVTTVLFLFLRIPKEEEMLLEYFKNDYLTYSSHSKRLIPFIF